MHTDGPDTGERTPSLADSGLTDTELVELTALLDQRRDGDAAEAQRLAESIGALLASRSESTSDDEHDPEGPTLSSEWSRLQALRSDATQDLLAVDAARERLRTGRYGVCLRCERPIGADRLRARPTAELCISCAIAVER